MAPRRRLHRVAARRRRALPRGRRLADGADADDRAARDHRRGGRPQSPRRWSAGCTAIAASHVRHGAVIVMLGLIAVGRRDVRDDPGRHHERARLDHRPARATPRTRSPAGSRTSASIRPPPRTPRTRRARSVNDAGSAAAHGPRRRPQGAVGPRLLPGDHRAQPLLPAEGRAEDPQLGRAPPRRPARRRPRGQPAHARRAARLLPGGHDRRRASTPWSSAIGALILGVPLVGTIAAVTFIGGYIPYLGAWSAADVLASCWPSAGPGRRRRAGMIVVQLLANGVLQQVVQPFAMGAALGHPPAGGADRHDRRRRPVRDGRPGPGSTPRLQQVCESPTTSHAREETTRKRRPRAPAPERRTMATIPENGEKRSRRAVPIVLIVLATLIGIVSVLAIWVKRQALETETWVDTSAQLLEDETISRRHRRLRRRVPVRQRRRRGRDRRQAPAAGRAACWAGRRRAQAARQPRRRRGASERTGAGGVGGREPRGPREADRPARGRGRVRLDHRWRGHPRPDCARDRSCRPISGFPTSSPTSCPPGRPSSRS